MEYAVEMAEKLLAIDSPSGYTKDAQDWLSERFTELGYKNWRPVKGGVIADLGGEGDGLLLAAHCDTLGAMVHEIKGSGRLKITNVGGLVASNVETENVRVRTRGGKCYEGTIQLVNASSHVNKDARTAERSWDSVEVVLDENVKNADDVRALGIENGDFVCVEPRFRVSGDGYIKSRFLDDKLSASILLAYAKYLKDSGKKPNCHLYMFMTVYEEVGFGASSSIPEGVTDVISVDMGCVGEGLKCTERQVSICAKDSGGPYNYELTNRLIEAAKKEGADYAVDIYPFYGSDVEASLRAGFDIRHGLIGPGVYASHGYERSHKDAVYATLKTLKGLLED
jgi:putative aminopeptidase FrvX